jgi:hypothetical protein
MVDLHRAREFAAWRFCRLPREEEWEYACTQGGSTAYPWGGNFFQTWANTHGLRLGRVTRVGSFESGRSSGGPFDLIGNVAEWTESISWSIHETHPAPRGVDEMILGVDLSGSQARREVFGLACWMPDWAPLPVEWLVRAEADLPRKEVIKVLDLPGSQVRRDVFGLACWMPGWAPLPVEWLVQAETDDLPRKVVGGSFRTTLTSTQSSKWPDFPLAEPWLPGARDGTTGVRLAADPDGLVRALAECAEVPEDGARSVLLRFLRDPKHNRVLAPAWARLRPWLTTTPMVELLDGELGG